MAKDFLEFTSTLDTKELSKIVNKEIAMSTMRTDDPEKLLSNNMSVLIATYTIELLGRYHEWLNNDE